MTRSHLTDGTMEVLCRRAEERLTALGFEPDLTNEKGAMGIREHLEWIITADESDLREWIDTVTSIPASDRESL